MSEEELTKWVKDVFYKRLTDGVEEDAKSKDTDGDGKVTWDEYTKESYDAEYLEDSADEEIKRMGATNKRRFDTTDKDKDGALTKEEFVHFKYPESSPEMGYIHVLETIEGRYLGPFQTPIFS